MFEAMKEELSALEDQIRALTAFEELYGNSEAMTRFLFRSYTNMIRFWHRVHKECNRTRKYYVYPEKLCPLKYATGISTIGHAITASAKEKLSAVVSELKKDVQCISQEATLCQAKLDSQEYAENQKERKNAAGERFLQSEWREKQNDHNYRA